MWFYHDIPTECPRVVDEDNAVSTSLNLNFTQLHLSEMYTSVGVNKSAMPRTWVLSIFDSLFF